MSVCTKAKVTSSPFRNMGLLGTEYAYFESRTGLTLTTMRRMRNFFVSLAWTNIQKYKHIKSQALDLTFHMQLPIHLNYGLEQSMEAYNRGSKNVSGPDYRCALEVNWCQNLYVLSLRSQRLTHYFRAYTLFLNV